MLPNTVLYRGGEFVPRVALQYGNVHLRNPAGSGVAAFVFRVTIGNPPEAGTVNGGATYGYYAPALGGAVYATRPGMDLRIASVSVCEIAQLSTLNPAIASSPYLNRCALASATTFADEDNGGRPLAVLMPGEGLLVHSGFPGMSIDAAITWGEARLP